MRLLNHLLNERHDNMLVDLTLKEILTAGKITNSYQNYILCKLAQGMPFCYTSAIKKELEDPQNESLVAEEIKKLSDEHAVCLAKCFYDLITNSLNNICEYPPISTSDWISYVSRKQN